MGTFLHINFTQPEEMHLNRKPEFRKLPGILLMLAGTLFSGQRVQWQGRVDFSLVNDSNVFESLSAPRQDNSTRLALHLNAVTVVAENHQIQLRYQGGLEGFSRFDAENRRVQHAALEYAWTPFRWIQTGINGQSRSRSFFQNDRGYHGVTLDAFARITLPWGLLFRTFTQIINLDHYGSLMFDYSGRNDGWMLMWRASRQLQIFTQYETGLMTLKGPAWVLETPSADQAILMPGNKNHKNMTGNWTGGVEWMGWMLCRLQMHYRRQVSNSYGYDYQRPGIELMMVKTLPWRLTLRAYGQYQTKQYLDNLAQLMTVAPDTEIEENRYVLIDLVRDITDNQAVRIRFGRYCNESPLRAFYYEKTMCSIGFTRSF